MATGRKIECPSCNVTLALPEGFTGQFVRCSKCRQRFAVPEEAPPSDADIASWLGEDEEEEISSEDLMGELGEESVLVDSAIQPIEVEQGGTKPVPEGEIRLIKFGRSGALFEFTASRLKETPFRCAMPRQCLRCNVRSHLEAHVIIYAPELADSVSLEEEHSAGKLALSDDEVRGLTDEQLLERLPQVPNIPAPGNMPMPYWTCDMCSAAGMISGQIQVNRETGRGWCRLQVRNLRVAEMFMANAGGGSTRGYRKLHRHVAAMAENPWDDVPEVVQHRIQQWFKPKDTEHFVAYVPDRDRARTEDGMAGILISTNRFIYHTKVRHHEVPPTEPLEFQLAMGSGVGKLEIRSDTWQVRMIVDRDGLARLRRGLARCKFKAVWH